MGTSRGDLGRGRRRPRPPADRPGQRTPERPADPARHDARLPDRRPALRACAPSRAVDAPRRGAGEHARSRWYPARPSPRRSWRSARRPGRVFDLHLPLPEGVEIDPVASGDVIESSNLSATAAEGRGRVLLVVLTSRARTSGAFSLTLRTRQVWPDPGRDVPRRLDLAERGRRAWADESPSSLRPASRRSSSRGAHSAPLPRCRPKTGPGRSRVPTPSNRRRSGPRTRAARISSRSS